jgi:F-type H+-transporting ATPase subunit b
MKRLALLALLAAPGFAFAEGEEGAHHEGGAHEAMMCDASSPDEACLEFWEHNINWWSWDYKAGPDQAPEHRHMPPPFGFALINFGVFLLIMYRLGGKPLAEFVRTRHVTIKKDLDEAAALRREASKKLEEYELKIAGIDEEIDHLIAQIRKEAEEEKARIVAAATEQAARLKTDAEKQIQLEIGRTQRALRAEAVAAAVTLAETLLREKLGPDDQKRLTDRYLADLEGEKRASAVRS